MKKILYSLVIIIIFLIPKVYAFDMQDLTSPYDGTFGNNNNSTYVISSIATYSDGYEWHTTNAITTSPSGGGASFCFSPPSILVKDHTYSITIAMTATQNGVTKPLTIVSLNNYTFVRAGYSVADAMTRTTGASIKYFGATTETIGTDTFYFMHYLIGATNGNYQSVCLPFTTTNSQSNMLFGFYGLLFDDLGYSSQLSQSDLTNVVNNINNEIHTYSQNIINNNNTNTQNIINNANSNRQQVIQNANDNTDRVLDDDVNSNTGKSFFDNFSDNTHGLSGIITAPLNIIQQLINVNPTSCSALSTTYHNKTISMECGKIFWGHTGFSEFNVFYNMVVGGAFCYLIIKDLFLTIEQLKDPDNDKVEVMDL